MHFETTAKCNVFATDIERVLIDSKVKTKLQNSQDFQFIHLPDQARHSIRVHYGPALVPKT